MTEDEDYGDRGVYASSLTETSKGTRKYQFQGPVAWSPAFRAAAGPGGREGEGIRSAAAFALAHREQWLEWAGRSTVDTLGQEARRVFETQLTATQRARAGLPPPPEPVKSGFRELVPDVLAACDLIKRTRLLYPKAVYGEKVFIGAVFALLRRTEPWGPTKLSRDRFERGLLVALRDGELVLSRADLVGAMDAEMVASSEIEDMGATFHFVDGPGSRKPHPARDFETLLAEEAKPPRAGRNQRATGTGRCPERGCMLEDGHRGGHKTGHVTVVRGRGKARPRASTPKEGARRARKGKR